jgi:DNA-binding transcriptional LysR family regulator
MFECCDIGKTDVKVTVAQLEAFYWTAVLGSAQRAGERLHLAQPTMSLRLKSLGSAMGAELLTRTGGSLQLTQAGRDLLPRVTSIMTELRGIGRATPGREITGSVRVGLAEGFGYTCLPPLLTALRQDHPGLEPDWVVSTSSTLEATLLRNALDLAVLLNPIGDGRLILIPLGAQPTCWVIPESWSLTEPVAPRDLWNLPIISNPPPSAMHRQVTGWFAAAGLAPTRLSSCTSVAVIAELVAGGIGAGLLPVAMTTRYVEAGRMRLLTTTPALENGRLFIARHAGIEEPKVTAVTKAIHRVLEGLDYLAR